MNIRKTCACLLALAMCLSLCACGAATKSADSAARYEMNMAAAPMPMAAPQENFAAYDMKDMAYEEAGFASMNRAASTAAKGADESGGSPRGKPREDHLFRRRHRGDHRV